MKHRKEGKKFGREKGQRNAFIKGLLVSLIEHERIETTDARAKAIRPEIEKMTTLAKKQTTASLRLLISRLRSKEAASKLFYTIAPRYTERNGGYTRIIKISKLRKGDDAAMSIIEFV